MKLLLVISNKMPYYDPKLKPEDIVNRLIDLDYELFEYSVTNKIEDFRVRIEIVGSAALVLNEINIPLTEDIDVVRMNRCLSKELLDKYDMNTRVTTMENYLPYNYQDRLVKLNINTFVTDYYFLSLEDCVVSKIVAARSKDDNQLDYLQVTKIDWLMLKNCMEEMQLSLLNINDYKWMINRYNNFVRKYNHEEAIITNL